MPISKHGTKIFYETLGDPKGTPLVLIEGMGAQSIGWRQEFRQKLVDRGMFVITPDNRDVGLSEKFGGPDDIDGGYTMQDMAQDMFGVLDTLELPSAHIVGQSMGGMMAQTMAISNPKRVKSMTLFYTAPGPQTYATDLLAAVIAMPPVLQLVSREEAIAGFSQAQIMCGSQEYPLPPEWIQRLATESFDRCSCPEGAMRQVAAVRACPNTLEQLRMLDTPAAVIQGRADMAIKVEAAFALGEALKNSEVHIYPGLGHSIAEPLWDDFVRIIERTVQRAGRA